MKQARPLNRLLALKSLGFSLAGIGGLMGQESESMPPIERLRLREAALRHHIPYDEYVVARVTARLRLIEEGHTVNASIETKSVRGLRVVGLVGTAGGESRPGSGPIVKELFERVGHLMDDAKADRTTPIAFYVPDPSKAGRVLVLAGYVLPEGAVPGLEIHTKSAANVASIVHRGAASRIGASYQLLATWAETNDYSRNVALGSWREVYLEANGDDQTDWIIELQLELS